jgi:MFS family permease
VNLSRYLEVLRAPGVARVAVFAMLGRLPFAIVPLSILLLMREEGYQYGQIGAVVGAESLAVGVTAGFVGRLVDRSGRGRVILVTGATTTLFLCTETIAILSDAPVWLLVVLAALQGATIPPISASMRSLWARLVPEETLQSAYAFDAIQLELVFVVGPLIAAGLATAISPAAGLLLCAGLYAWPRPASQPRRRHAPPLRMSTWNGRARGRSAPPACARSCWRAPSWRSRSVRSRWRSPPSPRRRARAERWGR